MATKLEPPAYLVTGGGSGIGEEIVWRFLENGYRVFRTVRTQNHSDANPNLTTIVVDLSDKDAVSEIARNISNTPLEGIIHNAAHFPYGANKIAANLDTDDWLKGFLVNVIVPTQLSWALRANLGKSQKKLVMLITSRRGIPSQNWEEKYPDRFGYVTSKAALNAAGVQLAQALPDSKVLLVHPGRVATKMTGYDKEGVSPKTSSSWIFKIIQNSDTYSSTQYIDASQLLYNN